MIYITIFSISISASENTADMLDQSAEQFVKLGLELGVYDHDYVDAFLGPKEWQEHANKSPRTKRKLANDIHSLLMSLNNLKTNDQKLGIRLKALSRNVRAMDTRIRMVNGETFSFAEEAKLIYDATLPVYDFREFDKVLEKINRLIPGDGPLSERVYAFTSTYDIPAENVKKVFDVAIAECRKRTFSHIQLPKSEHFTLEYVTNKNWSGYNWYQGDNHSLMQINQDLPLSISRALVLGCHEGYPGHHVWNTLLENKILKANNWVEFSIYPLFSPYSFIAEGSANYGVELAFPGDEKINFERDVLFPLAGLDPATAENLDQLRALTSKLSHSKTAIAQLYLDGKITRDEALLKIQKYSLTNPKKAEKSLRFAEQYRAYVLNYNLGEDIVKSYVEGQGTSQDQRWKAFESMLTELSTASDMVNH